MAKMEFLLAGLTLMSSMVQDDPLATRELHKRDAFIILGRVLLERYIMPELWELQRHACVDALYKLGNSVLPNGRVCPQPTKNNFFLFRG
mgnify:FL=1